MGSRLSSPEVIASLRDGRFLVVGRAGMDLYPEPAGTTITQASSFVADLGGSAGNIAVAIARHGKDVGLVSVLSDDAVGRFVASKLAHYGVATEHLHFADEPMTRSSLAIAESRPDDANVVIYRNNASDMQLSQAHVSRIDFDGVAALVLTGTALSDGPSDRALETLAEAAQKADKPVILDVDYRASAWQSSVVAAERTLNFTRNCDMIVGNDEEFALLATSRDRAHGDGFAFAREMAADGQIIVYKQGQKGCRLLLGNDIQQFGVFPVKLAKPFGSGDAFLGTLLARLQDDLSLEMAIREGSAAAALVVSRTGCASAMPDRHELASFMAGYASS
jgi:5-dehydro-2-deoxygluconokinase